MFKKANKKASVGSRQYLLSVNYMVISAVMIASVGLLLKRLDGVLDIYIIVFLRFFIAGIMLWWIGFVTNRRALSFNNVWLHILRAFFVVACWFCMLYFLKYSTVMNTMTFFYTGPIFIPLIAMVLYRTRIEPKVWAGILLGFVGIIFILKPSMHLSIWLAMVGLGSGVANAFSQILGHSLGKKEDEYTVTAAVYIWSSFLACVVLLFFAPHISLAQLGDAFGQAWLWVSLLSIGFLGITNQVLKIKAYKKVAQVTSLAPFMYLVIFVSGVYDWAFYHKLPDTYAVIGAVCIMLGGIIMAVSKPKAEAEEASASM